MREKILGLYGQSNTFWYADQSFGPRRWLSLETDDYRLALARARHLRPALDQRGPPPIWRSVPPSKGTVCVRFRVYLNAGNASTALARADRINAAVRETIS